MSGRTRYFGARTRYRRVMTAAPPLDPTQPVAIFLDFDGTLVHIVDRPDLTHVPASLLATLEDVYDALDGALALITGRPIADLDELLAPLRLPAAGVHGMEFRDSSGAVEAVAAPPLPEWARAEAGALAGLDPGLLMEDKVHGVALHFRQAPALEGRVRDAMQRIVARLGVDFVLQEGKMVVELRPACASKGTAVSRFMSQPPFAGREPVFIGDDVTDEDAFRVVNDMGGYSIKVGERAADSAARHELADVGAVRSWLLPLTHRTRHATSRSRP